jgi:UDPglucose--hexose-1-phosphate uridylyltransferase
MPELFTKRPAVGAHEVIINSPKPVSALIDLAPEEVETAMDAWRTRMATHSDAAYRHLIVNEGVQAGASLPHTHSQLYALPFVPAAVARERERFTAYFERTQGRNLLADVLQEEVRLRERIVAIDSEAVVICPFSSRMPFEMMLIPRTPRARFEDPGPLGAKLLHEALSRLQAALGGLPPLNMWIRTAPSGAGEFCWHLDVVPRLAQLAGLEMGTGVSLNIVAPEQAAATLRDAT